LLVEIGVFFLVLPFLGFTPTWTIVFLPIILGLLLVLLLGMNYLLSIAFAYAKDVQTFWGIITSVLFFATPVFWYLEDAGEMALFIQSINPLGQIIELAHKVVFGQIPPIGDWLYTTAIVFGILGIGYAAFQRFQKNILEKM